MDELTTVRVFCRMRPFIQREIDMGNLQYPIKMNESEVTIESKPDTDKIYNFDQTFDQTSTQYDIFNNICVKDISDFIEGFNVTQFAYGQSGCLHPDTEVMMFNGSLKKAKDIKLGDVLMGDDSRERKVLELFEGIHKMYEIIPEKGESYIVNEDHILTLEHVNPLTRPRSSYINPLLQWRHCNKPIDISVKNYLKKPIKWKNVHKGFRCRVEFDPVRIPIDPYILGLWLSTGYSYSTVFTIEDVHIKEYIDIFSKKINCESICNDNNEIYINAQDGGENLFLDFLNNYNILNNKHIPDIYKYNDREFRLSLLAGILDSTRGTYNDNEGIYEFKAKDGEKSNLLNDVIWLARSLGFGCYKTGVNESKCNIGGEKINEIPCMHYSNQVKIIKNTKDYSRHVGICVKFVGRGRYNGFMLDGNHRFLLGDFTCTHNSGKTFSMMGVKEDSNLYGIIPRSIEEIFYIINTKPDGWFFEIGVSYLEIYMERVNDLLDTSKENLQIRQNSSKGVYVENLTTENVGNIEEIYSIIKKGDSARKVTSTKLNTESSRSHSILSIYIAQTCPDGTRISSQLNLVDLAGSERADKTKATGELLKQGALINLSLTTLSQVINALSTIEMKGAKDQKSIPIPYRNSKLTRLLQPSFGGNSKTSLIIHISPHINNINESISTLEFGKRTKLIKNKASRTIKKSSQQLEQELKDLQENYDKLLSSVESGNSKDGELPESIISKNNKYNSEFKTVVDTIINKLETRSKLENRSKLARRISCDIIKDNSDKIVRLEEEIIEFTNENTRLKRDIESFEEVFFEIGGLEQENSNKKDDILKIIKNIQEENSQIKQENYTISQELVEKSNRLSRAELECFRNNISLSHTKNRKSDKIKVKLRSRGNSHLHSQNSQNSQNTI